MMVSDCCGAMIRFQDICGRCGEHCEPAEIDTDDGYDAAKDNYLTNGGYGYNDRTRREDAEWAEECRRNNWK
jgi:hypothetical protein